MIKNILFDFAGTIAELKPTRDDLLRDFLLYRGINLSKDFILKTYKYVDIALPYSSVNIKDPETKHAFYIKYNNLLFTMLGLKHIDKEIGNEFYIFFTKTKKEWVLKKNFIKFLEQLKNAGLSLSLISNFDINLKDVLLKIGVHYLFDYIYISQAVGFEKPDLTFYRSFFGSSKYKKEQTLYVGDSYLLDYLPAKALGMNVALLDENEFYLHIPDRIGSVFEINSRLEETVPTSR